MRATQVGRIAVDEQLRVLAPPKQEQEGGAVRAEGDGVTGPGTVRLLLRALPMARVPRILSSSRAVRVCT